MLPERSTTTGRLPFQQESMDDLQKFQRLAPKAELSICFKGRKVVLAANNYSMHMKVPELSAMDLVFLWPSTTSLLQPMDQGITKQLKGSYQSI